ncbi:MAG: DNA methyltransferase [Candidatus Thorarchaeota archaeon]
MSYREIPEDRILIFSSTAGFKGWKQFFCEDSITHPAKMNLNLLRWILDTYTEPGDVVLDPMAGTGSTIILAALMGRHGIAVEYESRFCEMIKENIKLTERQATLTPKGRMTCIQGDARQLSKLLGEPDVVITSPPYASPSGAIFDRVFMEKLARQPTSKRYGRKTFPGYGKYSESPEQIGNKPYGDIDTIVTSPPYSGTPISSQGADGSKQEWNKAYKEYKKTGNWKKFQGEMSKQNIESGYSKNEGNIGNLPHGDIEAIVTSPPYEGSYLGGGDQEARKKRLIESGHDIKNFFGGKARDATLKHYDEVDAVVTSLPYEHTTGKGLTDEQIKLCEKIQGRRYTKKSWVASLDYSDSEDNIGNLKSESYLEAMLQCYREFYKVLKDSGKLILVTKNFIRDKKVVRLDEDTIKLCKVAGFTLQDRWYFKLPQISFWRILYMKKFPDVPKILYEDILIFTKEIE